MSDTTTNKGLTPTGIFSIDKAIGKVIDSIGRDDPRATWGYIRLLADTIAEKEIILLAVKHSDETKKQIEKIEAKSIFTYADRYTKLNSILRLIEERNEDLNREIMIFLSEKGYSRKAGLLGGSSFKEMEEEGNSEENES